VGAEEWNWKVVWGWNGDAAAAVRERKCVRDSDGVGRRAMRLRRENMIARERLNDERSEPRRHLPKPETARGREGRVSCRSLPVV
jgi:hypothetical protein